MYKFLDENRIHPDVETVYNNVITDNPSFSKTTVYNCLKDLSACGLLIPVKVDADRIHYDANTSFHGHFRCEVCDKIFDFDCSGGNFNGLDNFVIKQRDVYFSGVCNCCNK